MKTSAALFLSFAFLVQGVAFAADANGADGFSARAAYNGASDTKVQAIKTSLPGSCRDGNCADLADTKSCGAYVSTAGHHGYGFGSTIVAAIGKAREMCGPGNQCQVVVAQCEE
jgi:hypothetical protein